MQTRGAEWRRPRRARAAVAAIGSLIAIVGAPAAGQQARRETPPLDLPRRGYEPHTTRVGPAIVRIELDVTALYDSNVYATSTKPIGDAVAVVRPRVDVDIDTATTQIHGEAYANARQYAARTRENAASFGAAIGGTLLPGRGHSVTSEVRFDRAIESRADPETRRHLDDGPRRINIATAELGYALKGSRFGLALTGGYQRFNYLDPTENDRDLQMYRGSANFTWRPAAPVAIFVEGYATRRNFDTAVDVNGIDRDATTIGALLGFSREASARLKGRVGIGIFRFDPDAPQLRSYTGVAASGEIVWTPRVRTAVTARVLRGDVATVRSGATGRTDTRMSVRLDQEARHNLLMQAELSWLQTSYRGPVPNRQNTIQARAEVDYLINRTFSIFGAVSAARRSADIRTDSFSRATVEAGVRVRF